jgi:hypothetical protein
MPLCHSTKSIPNKITIAMLSYYTGTRAELTSREIRVSVPCDLG